ncbi:hypothetical protein OZN62_03685 [Aurantiacibacter sp. MUD11]|uniref:hypothetical protein n=1 Tax=Aurantiacibacter sp. MUD11 TaxID=3003265 RepID=UPI0022AA6852|nr:hypothetical protein [Aurantiacibacter sp. MUD11]WAT18687.1 hypothetical protein OZN62_03685 [Aurantiacibacter sp. MUD11]
MNTTNRTALALATASLALSSCGSPGLTRPQVAAAPTASEIEVQAVSLNCGPGGIGVSSVTPALVGLAVDFAFKFGEGLLERAQSRRNAVWAASGIARCVETPGGASRTYPLSVVREVRNVQGSRVGDPGFALSGNVTFHAATRGTGNSAKPAITIEFAPTEFVYGRHAPTRSGSGRKHVIAYLVFSESPFLAAGSPTGEEKAITGALRIDLGRLEDGFTYPGSMIGHAGSVTTIDVPASPNMVMTAIVFESDDPSLALDAFTEAFSDNEDAIVEALRDLFGGSDADDDE